MKGQPKVNMACFIIAAMEAMMPYLNAKVLEKASLQQRFACFATIQTLKCIADRLTSSKELVKSKEIMSLFLSEYINHFNRDYIEMGEKCDLIRGYNIAQPQLAENELL